MGRLRDKCHNIQTWPDGKFDVFDRFLKDIVDVQEKGEAFYGECIYSQTQRVKKNHTFCPFEQHLTELTGPLTFFRPEEFKVEIPNVSILNIPIPVVPPVISSTHAVHQNQGSSSLVPKLVGLNRACGDEVHFVKELRDKGHTWQDIAEHFPSASPSQLRKRYITALKTPLRPGIEQKEPIAKRDFPFHGTSNSGQKTPLAHVGKSSFPSVIMKDSKQHSKSHPPMSPIHSKRARRTTPTRPIPDTPIVSTRPNSTPPAQHHPHPATTPYPTRPGPLSLPLSGRASPYISSTGPSSGKEVPLRQYGGQTLHGLSAILGHDSGLTPLPTNRALTPVLGARSTPEMNQSATTPPPESQLEDLINHRAVARINADRGIRLKRPMYRAPPGFTGMAVHHLSSLEGVKFYEEVEVVDPDDPTHIFTFSLGDPTHCACFNLGTGPDGSPLLSWSDLLALYQLPDGSRWAEHGYLLDRDDLEELIEQRGMQPKGLSLDDLGSNELVRKAGRYHSRLQNIEFESWIYAGEMPTTIPEGTDIDNVYFYRYSINPYSLEASREVA